MGQDAECIHAIELTQRMETNIEKRRICFAWGVAHRNGPIALIDLNFRGMNMIMAVLALVSGILILIRH